MNLLWVGKPKSRLLKAISAEQFVISHTFEIHRIDSNANRVEASIPNFDNHHNKNFLSFDPLDKLPYLIDIWSRWDISNQLSWSRLTNQSIDIVNHLVHVLSHLQIDRVVACYATPHHFWNNLVELACEVLQIPVLRLYPFLELDISLPLLGNNHNILSVPSAEFNYEWDRYTTHKINSYISRVQNVAFSPDSIKCFKNRFRNPLYVRYCRYMRFFKLSIAPMVRKSSPYNPLAFANLMTTPWESLSSLRYIQDTQDKAVEFYLNNITPSSSLANQSKAPIFILIGHVQPEASTSPMGGGFYCQLRVAEYLRSKYPQSRIYYKEHPGSFYTITPGGSESLVGISRNVTYYKRLLSLGVNFLPVEGNVISLLKQCPHLIPVTITGSVAVEAPISIAAPCIYFGEPYWLGYPGSFYHKDVDWPNITEQFNHTRSNSESLLQNSTKWLSNRASFSCLPNIMGYGISSKEIAFTETIKDLFYARLNHYLSI